MGSSVRWRLAMVAAVIALCVWLVYPPKETIKLGLDLNGGAQLVLRVKVNDPARVTATVQDAIATIERRVNALGVAEATVARYGQDDQILVELPGVADVERAKQIIKSTSQLRLTLVERGPFPLQEAALQSYSGALPAGME